MMHKRDENGLVAIMVATMIMIVMSLVVLGFAHLMQREQTEALNKALSTQAFYAAESGINDAVTRIHDISLPPLPNKTTCDTSTGPGNTSGLNGSIDNGLASSYSCLLINNTPTTLEYTQKSITTDGSTIVPIRGANNEVIHSVEISWGDEGLISPTFRSCPATSLPASGAWGNSPGILRLDLVPTDPDIVTGVVTRTALIGNAMNAYLMPVPAAGGCGSNTFDYNAFKGVGAGQIQPVKCTVGASPHECHTLITGLATQSLYLRMRSVYDGSNVTVRIFDNTGTQLAIRGAQVQIDTTGRVADVVRRLQVRIPLKPTYTIPDDALETTLSICKQLAVVPNFSATPSAACNTY